MKFTLWIIVIFVVAVLFGLVSSFNIGYAVLFIQPYRIELSINSLLICVLALFAIFYILLRLFIGVSAMPSAVRRYARVRKARLARTALCRAGIAFFEGRLQKSEAEANKALYSANSIESNALALLFATSASGSTQNTEKHAEYLAKLDAMPKKIQLARHVLEAEQRLDAHKPLEALASIEKAREISGNLTRAIKIELRIRIMQKQPKEALLLLDKLVKSKMINAEQLKHYRLEAYRQQLALIINSAGVNSWFKRLPEDERKNPKLIKYIASHLVSIDEADAASLMLARALSDSQLATPELANKLGQIATQLSAERRLAALHDAEQWLKNRPRDAELLLALGRMSLAQQLWGKAQSYLEASLSINPNLLLAHVELAKLYDTTGKPEMAEKARSAGLSLALKQAN